MPFETTGYNIANNVIQFTPVKKTDSRLRFSGIIYSFFSKSFYPPVLHSVYIPYASYVFIHGPVILYLHVINAM